MFLYKGSVEPKIKSTVVVHSRNVFLCKKVLSLAIISNIKNHFAMSVHLHVCIASVTLCIMYLCLSKHLSASYIHRLHCKIPNILYWNVPLYHVRTIVCPKVMFMKVASIMSSTSRDFHFLWKHVATWDFNPLWNYLHRQIDCPVYLCRAMGIALDN